MFRIAAILHGVLARALQGNAASANALEQGSRARLVADVAWDMAQRQRSTEEHDMDFAHSPKVKDLQARRRRASWTSNVYPAEPAFAAEVEANRQRGNRVGRRRRSWRS